jgi:hypothetical protein
MISQWLASFFFLYQVTQADVDSLLSKFGNNGVVDQEGLLSMLEEFTREGKSPAADLLHWRTAPGLKSDLIADPALRKGSAKQVRVK